MILIPIGKVCRELQVSSRTLVRWEKKGIAKPMRVPRGKTQMRFYTQEEVEKLKNFNRLSIAEKMNFTQLDE